MTKIEWRYRLLYPALWGLGLSALVSCAPVKPPSPPPVASLRPAPSAPLVRRRRPLPPSIPRPQEKPAPLSATGFLAPIPRPHDLIGLSEKAAAQLFGVANQKINRPPATIWRYRADDCVLDLYFYLDLESGRMRTLRYAFDGLPQEVGSREACLTTILQRNNPKNANVAHPSR